MFKFVRVGSQRVGHARHARKLIPAFVGAGHALPAVDIEHLLPHHIAIKEID